MSLTFGSLFAGIGGFDLGFERAGMSCKWQVEIDDYATKVLEKHWPDVHRERDIRECGRGNLERVDVICGGFPCQDISYAGRGAGLDGERSGLFFEAVRVVRELRPRCVVLENVAALLTRGLDRVLGTLAEIGFDAEWHCIPASSVGAPHIRDRVFVMAYAQHNGLTASEGEYQNDQQRTRREEKQSGVEQPTGSGRGRTISADVADTGRSHGNGRASDSPLVSHGYREVSEDGQEAADHTERRCGSELVAHTEQVGRTAGRGIEGNEGRAGQRWREPCASGWWQSEPDVGRVAHGVPSRVDRLRGLGNAVVPQVAEYVGRMVMERINE